MQTWFYLVFGWLFGPFLWLWMWTGWAWPKKYRTGHADAWREFDSNPKYWWYNYHETFSMGLYPWLKIRRDR